MSKSEEHTILTKNAFDLGTHNNTKTMNFQKHAITTNYATSMTIGFE